jgi:hypothetical protein
MNERMGERRKFAECDSLGCVRGNVIANRTWFGLSSRLRTADIKEGGLLSVGRPASCKRDGHVMNLFTTTYHYRDLTIMLTEVNVREKLHKQH